MSFPRYPAYKDSGVEWLGEVPEHWEVRRLKRNLHLLTEKAEQRDFAVALENIEGWTGRFVETDSELTGEGVSFDSGDILFGKLRPYLGKAWVADRRGEAVGDFHVLHPTEESFSRFSLYQILTAEFISIVDGSTFGAKMPRVGWDFLSTLPLATPPFSEQIAIASFLDRETAKIDALVSDYRALIELLQEKRQAIISHAVTKGLDSTVPMKDSGVEWLGEVPEHWGVVRLKFLATVQTGVAKGKDNSGKTVVDVAYLRVANVQNGYLDLAEVAMIEIPQEDLDRYLLRNGDVLMNEGGDNDKLGRGHIWGGEVSPCIHQNHVFAVRPIKLSSDWLNRVTGSSYAQFYFLSRSKQSTNLASISSTNIMELPVALPPDIEQVVIGTFLDREISNLDSLITDAEEAITLLQVRRIALISAAVTGKIDVRGLVETEVA